MPFKNPEDRRRYQKKYHRRWYDKNAEDRRKQVRLRKKGIREWFRELKEGLHCEVCGISGKDQAWVLEFHHIEPASKKEGISYLVSHGYGKKRILDEIEKCVVICANDHRAEHYQEFMEARRNGTHDDIWTRSGKAGSQGQYMHPNSRGKGRQAKRRRERRLRRNRRKNREDDRIPGPNVKSEDNLDSLLQRVEAGHQLDATDLATLRRLATGDHHHRTGRTSQWDEEE